MIPTAHISDSELCYPVWILEFLQDEYPYIYEDLITRKTPQWLKPTTYDDYFYDSIIQKVLLWADPGFIQFSCGFIQAVDAIIRSDLPVIHIGNLFDELVSFSFNSWIFEELSILWLRNLT